MERQKTKERQAEEEDMQGIGEAALAGWQKGHPPLGVGVRKWLIGRDS